jgi:pentatricopeptide repeat protein
VLQIAGRTRDVRAAGEVSKIAALMAQGGNLGRQEYLAIINSQFWLKQDHEQLLQTVAAMKAAGHDLNEHTLQQLLNVYCHNGMWGEALQVLNDVAAGRFTAASSTGSSISSHQISTGARRQDSNAVGEGSIDNDKLWHVVLRKLWEKRASDELLNEFLRHIAPAQLQRFKLLYGLHKIPGEQPGQPDRYSLRPLEDWQLPLQQQQRQQQQQDQLQELEQLEQEGQGYVQPPEQLQKLPDDTAFPAVRV